MNKQKQPYLAQFNYLNKQLLNIQLLESVWCGVVISKFSSLVFQLLFLTKKPFSMIVRFDKFYPMNRIISNEFE